MNKAWFAAALMPPAFFAWLKLIALTATSPKPFRGRYATASSTPPPTSPAPLAAES
jgi:hypothetical protein